MTAAAAKSLQSCLTLCDPIDRSPPGSPVPGILQARTLEWVAISFSSEWKWKVKSLSRVQLFTTPWTIAYQAALSMGFPRQEYWSGLPLPSPQMSLENTVDYICLSVHIYESALWNSTVKETCCGTTFSLASPRLIGRELSIPVNIPWLFWFLSTFSLQGCVPPKCVETGELSYSYTTFHILFPRNFSLFALWSYKLSFCLCAVLTDCSLFLCRPVRGKLTEWNTNQDPFPLAESLLLPVQSLLPNQ